MTEYAIVKENVVITRIVANLEFAEAMALEMSAEAVFDDSAQVDFIRLEDGSFEPPPPPPKDVDEHKDEIFNEIEARAAELVLSGVGFKGDQIPITEKTLKIIFGIRGNNTKGVDIILSKSKVVFCPQENILELQASIEAKIEEIRSEHVRLIALVNAATTVIAVLALNTTFQILEVFPPIP